MHVIITLNYSLNTFFMEPMFIIASISTTALVVVSFLFWYINGAKKADIKFYKRNLASSRELEVSLSAELGRAHKVNTGLESTITDLKNLVDTSQDLAAANQERFEENEKLLKGIAKSMKPTRGVDTYKIPRGFVKQLEKYKRS